MDMGLWWSDTGLWWSLNAYCPPRAQAAWHGHRHGHGGICHIPSCSPKHRSIRTLFLKDAIPRCSAEGEMLGRGPGGCVREGKRVFSLAGCFSPAICHICSRRGRAQAAWHSPAWREQLTQLDEGQHQPSPKPVPCRGTVLFRALPDTSTTGQAPLPSQDSGSHLLCPLVSTLA